jgi:two-component system, NarL family, response regulator LiaR
VVERLRDMLLPFFDRVAVVDMQVGSDDVGAADVALFDTLGGQRHALSRAQALVERHQVRHVVVYANDPSPAFVRAAEGVGVSDVIDKGVVGKHLVQAIEEVAGGRARPSRRRSVRVRSPKGELTLRDTELMALLALGLSNEQIADESFIGVETVRTHLQHLYQRLGVRDRKQAALRAADIGLAPMRAPTDRRVGRRHSQHFRRAAPDVRVARSFVAGVLEECGASDSVVQIFQLAVSELGANVVMHGDSSGWTVGLKVTREWYTMDVSGGRASDDSMVFDPGRWTIADADQPNGRGLGIVRQLMDDVSVETWRGHVRVVCRLRQTTSPQGTTNTGRSA